LTKEKIMAETEAKLFYLELKAEKEAFETAKDKTASGGAVLVALGKCMKKASSLFSSEQNFQKKQFVLEAFSIFLDKVDLPFVEGEKEAKVKMVARGSAPMLIEFLWEMSGKDVSTL